MESSSRVVKQGGGLKESSGRTASRDGVKGSSGWMGRERLGWREAAEDGVRAGKGLERGSGGPAGKGLVGGQQYLGRLV